MAVDSPALEDATAGRGAALLNAVQQLAVRARRRSLRQASERFKTSRIERNSRSFCLNFIQFLLHTRPDIVARGAVFVEQRDQVSNLGESETEALAAADEAQGGDSSSE